LYDLLSNLLAWSRLQRGIFQYHPEKVALKTIILHNIRLLQPNADQKAIMVKTQIDMATPYAYGDVNMIDTVIRNLLANAIKFTSTGGRVVVSVISRNQDFQVSISDTGIGIEAEHLPKLFRVDDRYRQAGTNGEEGTGLGLILCKEFVEQNGGTIWCESEFGKGSVFSFTLPIFQPDIHDGDFPHPS
jgi:signal transduction histidine kinase